jgi:hypothetical protein
VVWTERIPIILENDGWGFFKKDNKIELFDLGRIIPQPIYMLTAQKENIQGGH